MNAPIRPAVYTALFPFGGLGAGARGFLQARSSLLGRDDPGLLRRAIEYLERQPMEQAAE